MKWQEYQQAVEELYEHLAEQGELRRNLRLPDRETGRFRQVDVWWETDVSGHRINVLVDAKLRRRPLDVRDVEGVLALGKAVGAYKCVIVTSSGWSAAAEKKAESSRLDLVLLPIEDALEHLDIESWRFCPVCESDCIVLSAENAIERNGLWFWWLAGRCRECSAADVWCQDCGCREIVPGGKTVSCYCGHQWRNRPSGLELLLVDGGAWIAI